MSQPLFITIFCTLTLVIGTGIFFYWRYTYGIWAINRQNGAQSQLQSQEVVTLDPSWTGQPPAKPSSSNSVTSKGSQASPSVASALDHHSSKGPS